MDLKLHFFSSLKLNINNRFTCDKLFHKRKKKLAKEINNGTKEFEFFTVFKMFSL